MGHFSAWKFYDNSPYLTLIYTYIVKYGYFYKLFVNKYLAAKSAKEREIVLFCLKQMVTIHILMLDGTNFWLILYRCFIVSISSFRLGKAY